MPPRSHPRPPDLTPSSTVCLDELRVLYAEIDAALEGFGCEGTTDCCRFGVTGREPYPTAVELSFLEKAVRARGGLPKRRSLPVAGERRCDLLGDDGKCLVYDARPFGCRTFYCHRAHGPGGAPPSLPRETVRRMAGAIATLSARFAPEDPGPRPLSRVGLGALSRRSR
jgi:uncharacterized protein